MWRSILQRIIEEKESYNERVNIGANKTQLATLKRKISEIYNINIPKVYLDFLEKINGLEFNGFVIYGISDENNESEYVTDFISTNEIWNENDNTLRNVFFGDSNISWYCYDTVENEYVELDKPSGSLIRSFDSFEPMLEVILTDCLR